MSYCRFSTDDYQCDVYAYESCYGGYTVHVAGARYVFPEPLPPPIDGPYGGEAGYKRHLAVSALIERAELVPINLPHDGATLNVGTLSALSALLADLKHEGYNVPQDIIDRINEEASDEQRKMETGAAS